MRLTFTLAAACLATVLLLGCVAPPPSAYVAAEGGGVTVKLGGNEVGEACTQDAGPGEVAASIYCGSWRQPSARVAANAGPGGTPAALTASGVWRDGLDRRLDCTGQSPAMVLGRYPASVLSCTTRLGGWPQVAIAAEIDGRIWLADGVRPALPAIERSMGVLSGKVAPGDVTAQPVSAGLTAQRLAARAFGSGDIGQYRALIRAANRANVEGNFAGAEDALRTAAALQEKVQGRDSPALAPTLASEALQLSNQGRYAAAEAMFARAATLADSPRQADRLAQPLLWHYRGLHLMNQGRRTEALATLRRAEQGYGALLPPEQLVAAAPSNSLDARLDNQQLQGDETARHALLGVIETRRAEARDLRLEGRMAESSALSNAAGRLAQSRDIDDARVQARLYRTAAFIDDAQGRSAQALSDFSASAAGFGSASPGSRTLGETELLLAAQQMRGGRAQEALASCRTAASVLREANSGTSGELLQPCLKLFATQAGADPAGGQALLAEMFALGQLARGSITSQQIAQASSRLAENAHPREAALIRAHDDQAAELADLLEQRNETPTPTDAPSRAVLAELDKRIAALQGRQADSEQALQAALPNYGQLVQQVVTAREVLAALHPGEAFAATVLSRDAGWTFLLADGRIEVAPISGGTAAIGGLVKRVRASLDSETEPPPPFDTQAAEALYDHVLRGVEGGLHGATALSVAPSGPLLALPFGLMLTGHGASGDLAEAPWLIRRLVVEHVPAPANFVSLRKLAGTSRASRPWFGFGDFHPVSQVQAERSFPTTSCADSATLLAGLPPLPGARVELEAVRRLSGAGPADEMLGGAFTASAVRHAALKDVRVLHFATHALLPTDLRCQNEPALVTSAPPGAADAGGALLTASQVTGLDLDADAVVLSACNTGGPAGATSGESLTGLARSFFFAGARALLVTHWSVNDRTTTYLVALTLSEAARHPERGLAGALAAAQRRFLSEAQGDVAAQAHPFYWAALAVIGEGMGSRPAI